jgi:hypothetical protein
MFTQECHKKTAGQTLSIFSNNRLDMAFNLLLNHHESTSLQVTFDVYQILVAA